LQNHSRQTDGSRVSSNMSSECDRDSRDGTARRECRITVINPKRFPTSSITIISLESLFPELVIMLNTGIEPNLIKARSSYSTMQILRKNKLHIISVTDGFVESLGFVDFIHLKWILLLTISQSLKKEFWEQIF